MDFAIELTEEESTLLSAIELDPSKLDYEQCERQGPLILSLLTSLKERNAIPEVRLRYWSDPEYQIGRLKTSHKGLFERNGRRGAEIYTHPHFLKYLRYFICGAQLPVGAIAGFKEVIGTPEWVSSSDLNDIAKGTRHMVRKLGLQNEDEEFYQLALDLGLSQPFAKSVRDAVKQVR